MWHCLPFSLCSYAEVLKFYFDVIKKEHFSQKYIPSLPVPNVLSRDKTQIRMSLYKTFDQGCIYYSIYSTIIKMRNSTNGLTDLLTDIILDISFKVNTICLKSAILRISPAEYVEFKENMSNTISCVHQKWYIKWPKKWPNRKIHSTNTDSSSLMLRIRDRVTSRTWSLL